MAILICTVAAVGLTGMIGGFLLYVPLMSALWITMISLALLAMFALGIHAGIGYAALKEEDEETESKPSRVPAGVVMKAASLGSRADLESATLRSRLAG